LDIVKTKDGFVLGKKSDLNKVLLYPLSDDRLKTKIQEAGGTFDTTNFYNCLISKIETLDPRILSNLDSTNALSTDCFLSSIKFKPKEQLEEYLIMKYCRDSLAKHDELNKIGMDDAESIDSFCACFTKRVLSIEESNRQEIMDGDVTNNLILPCIHLAQSKSRKKNDVYNPNEIIGSLDSSTLNLLKIGDHKMVQITIGDITKYYLLDTGSDLLLIDDKSEQELINSKKLLPSMFIGERQLSLADNRQVNAKIYKINKVKIGDYIVRNVEIGVIENGSLLCGMSLLKKFRHWKIDSEVNALKLFK